MYKVYWMASALSVACLIPAFEGNSAPMEKASISVRAGEGGGEGGGRGGVVGHRR